MHLVNERHAVEARMLPSNDNGYVLLAAEVEWRGLLRPPSTAKQQLLAEVNDLSQRLAERDDVIEATVFRAVLVAPGEGTELVEERDVHRARYDVVVLIRTNSVESARHLRDEPDYLKISNLVRDREGHVLEVVARNAVRLGDVDHDSNHVFLFNYFYADDEDELIPVFEYTAGWFQHKTDLPNSTLLQPVAGEASDNGIINHASWPNFRIFLPSLIFRPTFRRFVLANFKANSIAAQPILYRRLPK